MPNFNTFLEEFCFSVEDRKEWVKGFLCYVLLATTAKPRLFYIFGEGKSGINILISILCGLVGDSVWVSTVEDFNRASFLELSLGDKRVILINNSVDSKNNTDIAEVLQTFEMFSTVNVIIIGSQKLQTLRFQNHPHIKSFKSEGRPQNLESLIRETGHSWFGALVEQRSSIFNWLVPCTQGQYKYIFEASEYVLSSEVCDDSETSIDHFSKWVQEEIVVDFQAITPLGASPIRKKVKEGTELAWLESSLFATYLNFCSRHEIPETAKSKHTMFGGKLLQSCLKLGSTVAKRRRSGG